MSFDRRDIRPSMDVFTRDDIWLGSVLRLRPGAGPPARASASASFPASEISGESLGPAPTEPVGNRGPANQGARAGFGARPDGAEAIGGGEIVVGRWWGLADRRTIPLDAVLSVSLERVTLRVGREELARRVVSGQWSVVSGQLSAED
jgi:hypothetical protein